MSIPSKRAVTAVIVVAAGSGERLGYGMPKAQVPLGGETILMHALRGGVVASDVARQICVAVPKGGDTALRESISEFTIDLVDGGPEISIVDGGSSRADSVRAAMAALEDGTELVLVHDAARALTPPSGFSSASPMPWPQARRPSFPPCLWWTPSKLLPRRMAQTPPSPPRKLSREQLPPASSCAPFRPPRKVSNWRSCGGLTKLPVSSTTSNPQLSPTTPCWWSSSGVPVHAVRGASQSLKITTPLDLIIAEGLLEGPLGIRWVEG